MNSIKAIVFDYDGTLKDHKQKMISHEIRDLLTKIHCLGVKIILATGRPHNHCTYLMDTHLVDCIVSSNGSLTKTSTQVISYRSISEQTVTNFNYFCKVHSIPCVFYTDKLTTNGIVNDDLIIGLKSSMNLTLHDISLYTEPLSDNIFLMCAFCNSEYDQQLISSFPNSIVSRWHPHITSVTDETNDKICGIMDALKYYGINFSETIAVGDGLNDLEMIKKSGYGISVGKTDNILALSAQTTIPKVDHALYDLIRNFC